MIKSLANKLGIFGAVVSVIIALDDIRQAYKNFKQR